MTQYKLEDYLEDNTAALSPKLKSIENGKDAELLFEKILLEDVNLNFRRITYNNWKSGANSTIRNSLVTDLPFVHPITKNNGFTEYGLAFLNEHGTRIMLARVEVKHQDASGSVTEKLEALSNRMKRGDYPEDLLILVVSGDIYTKEYCDKLQAYYDDDLAAFPHKKIWVKYPEEITAKFICTELEPFYDKYHS